jgi:adenylate kinase
MNQEPLHLVLLGGPGSGKGTHGQALADAFHLRHLSTGAHFRRHMAQKTDLGVIAQGYIDRGQLVPDEVATRLLTGLLNDLPSAEGFVLDGYPRSLVQARDLKGILEARNKNLSAALYLKISDAEIIRRLSGRLTCRQCEQTFHELFNPPLTPGICPACGGELYRRDDDHPDTIRKRVQVFHQSAAPLLEFYRKENLLCEIDAEGPPARVRDLVVQAAREAIGIKEG